MSEAKIRDFLANNLDFLEPGNRLQLIQKEFPLKNPFGADGKVDILAKDVFGNYIVIEIKKSNSSAREALHELHKYVALVRQDLGISSANIRCILASSVWHELMLPFSEFKKTVDFHVDGIHLLLDEVTGIPVGKKIIQEILIQEPKKLYPIHHIHLFSSDKFRRQGKTILENQLNALSVTSYIITSLDHYGKNEEIIFSFALYLVIYEFSLNEKIAIEKTVDLFFLEPDASELEEADLEENDEDLEGTVLSKLTLGSMRQTDLKINYSNIDLEAGSSESFLSMLQRGWKISSINRYGYPRRIEAIINDVELVKFIAGFDGENQSIFSCISNSKYKQSWNSFIGKLYLFLEASDEWGLTCKGLIDEYLMQDKEIIVSVRIYDAISFLDALCLTAWTSDLYLPALDIFIDIPSSSETIVLRGFLEWNRKKFPSIEEVFKEDAFSVFQECRTLWGTDSAIPLIVMIKHGIQYSMMEYRLSSSSEKSIKHIELGNDDSIERHPYDINRLYSIREFAKENVEYLNQLRYLFCQANLFPDPFSEEINWGNFEVYCQEF